MYYAVIMAGGSGTRLWPLSRELRPKQSLKLIGERTMFQHAVERLAPVFDARQICVVTRAEHAAILHEQTPQLPNDNFILEPEGRGTAPAIGLAAIYLKRKDPHAIMAVLTADHYIVDTKTFCNTLGVAAQIAQEGHLVTLGIRPSFASTGFGYIQQGEKVGNVDGLQVYRVKKFTEKPAAEVAQEMVASGEFSWNSGMFVWRVDRILEEFRSQMPDFYNQLMEVEAHLDKKDFEEVMQRTWHTVAKQTIDYGIMEGAGDVVVIPVEIGWTDIGSWASLFDLLPADEKGNTVIGEHIGVETENSLILGGHRLIATIGVENMVIVDTEDALLVCSKEKEQEVKNIVNQLKQCKGERWL